MKFLTRSHLWGLAIAVAVYAIDQAVKWLMIGPLALRRVGEVYILPFFQFTYAENKGVSLGMLPAESTEMRLLLIAVTSLIALIVLVWMLREKRQWDIAGLALILGGACGNIWDRWTEGFVIDYLDLHFGAWRPFYVFNLADTAITFGVVIILARSIFLREKHADESEPADKNLAETAPETN
jgi:signal peptidase II